MKSLFKSIVLSAAATAATYAVLAWMDREEHRPREISANSSAEEIDADGLTSDLRDAMLTELETQL